jgi:hypothetical protein
VSILDGSGDQTPWFPDDVPGQGPAEACGADGAVRVGRNDVVVAVGGGAVVLDPGEEGGDVVGNRRRAPRVSPAGAAALAQMRVQFRGEQQALVVESFEDGDRLGGLGDNNPRVGADLAFGDLVALVVPGALELLAGDRPDPGGLVVGQASAFEVERYWWKVPIPTMRYSSPETRT